MNDKPEQDLAAQMQAARELLEEGEVGQALVMAMDVLWRELDQLQGALQTVEDKFSGEQEIGVAFPRPAEPSITDYFWPVNLGTILH